MEPTPSSSRLDSIGLSKSEKARLPQIPMSLNSNNFEILQKHLYEIT